MNVEFDQKEKVVLIDVSGILHAAWHAYPPSIGEDGQCYRVLHGVLSKIHRLERALQWDHLVAVMDSSEGSLYRKAIYPDYKGHRKEEDADLVRQKELVHALLLDTGIHVLKRPGVEADDLIGCLARKKAAEGALVLVMTPDKDLTQLIEESISILKPNRGILSKETPFDFIDKDGVKEKFGIWPNQIPDYLALLGDSVDNIPGVDKVGPKKAAALLQKYGDLETILTHADEIGGVVGENLKAFKSIAPQIKQLTTIMEDLIIEEAEYLNPKRFDEVIFRGHQKKYGMPPWMGIFGTLDNVDAANEEVSTLKYSASPSPF